VTSVKVIAVDDDPSVLKAIKAVLEPLGCEVVMFEDAASATVSLRTQKVDGIFVDAQMPGANGFDLTKAVRESGANSRAPIVLLSDVDDAVTMRKGFHAGATFFLGKPLTRERIYHLFAAARGAMLVERRRHQHLPFRTAVKCGYSGKQLNLQSINLSESGMLLDSAGGMGLGQEFDLEFLIPPGPKPILARARTVRQEASDHVAIEFVTLRPEDQQVLQRHLNGDADDWKSGPGK
jgi:CheY-like chemotaxis protein